MFKSLVGLGLERLVHIGYAFSLWLIVMLNHAHPLICENKKEVGSRRGTSNAENVSGADLTEIRRILKKFELTLLDETSIKSVKLKICSTDRAA